MNGGATVKLLGAEIAATLQAVTAEALKPHAAALAAKLGEWAELTRVVGARVAEDPEELGAVAVDYLQFAGCVLVGWAWLRMANVAAARLAAGHPERAFYEGKLAAAAFYFERLLPRSLAHAAAVRAGGATLPTLTAEHFAA